MSTFLHTCAHVEFILKNAHSDFPQEMIKSVAVIAQQLN